MINKRIVVITGASDGIGLAAAKFFAEKGYTVYGLNRRIPESSEITYIQTDVTDPESVKKAFSLILEKEGRVDILINNAGYGISGAVEFTGNNDAKGQLDVNFFGTFNCIKEVLPIMRKQKAGRIINISSVAGVIPIPFQSFYSASKAAVNAMTLALINEIKPFGIRMTSVMPGDVKTGFTRARRKEKRGSEIYTNMEGSIAVMEKDEKHGMSPEYIAGKIYALSRKKYPKPLYTFGASYKVFVLLAKILPARVSNRIVGMLYS